MIPAPNPGVYPGLPMAGYLAMPAVSAHLLKQLLERCPYAAWHESWMNARADVLASTKVQSAGTVAHSMLLEGRTDIVQVIDPKDHPNEKGGGIPAGWTNKSIKAARDAALEAGKVPMLPGDFTEVLAMVEAAKAFIESLRDTEPAIWALFQPGGGESEITMVWREKDGTPCRIRPDRIALDRSLIADYKTGGTSAEPNTWGRTQMVKMAYYVSAAFYRRGIKAITGKSPAYVWLVQEQEAPYLCSLVGADPMGEQLGDRKTARALAQWSSCVATGKWPAYPNRVVYPEIPAWEMAREEIVDAPGIPYDIEKAGWKEARASSAAAAYVDAMPD